ncbi:hypothetical protein [Chengkuizengella marina]|uniref:Uncharacterized protein n=1 Tax=Chengkuizengella marina TaxID=2507566 RepID=A0A6N9Q934_9BACL|nr:hypothetical protein [Chengkuizengella marina]NBI31143.1 hypothetical protein [Chengkuizengella marina]
MNNKIDVIEKKIFELLKKIMADLRPAKIINKSTFNQLYRTLDELKPLIKEEEYVKKSLVDKLFFLQNFMIVQADYANYSDELMKEIQKVGSYLVDIFK